MFEMLTELDDDIWETLAKCFQFRLLNHWTEDEHAVGKTAGYDGQEKELQIDDERFPPNCNAPDDVPFVFKDPTAVGRPGNTHQTQPTVSLVVRLMRWSSSCAAWWNKQPSGRYQFS